MLARWCLEAGELIDTGLLFAAWERVVQMTVTQSHDESTSATGAGMGGVAYADDTSASGPAHAAQSVSMSRASFGEAAGSDEDSETGGGSGGDVQGCQACLLRSLLRIADHTSGLALGAVEAGEGVPGARRVVEMQMCRYGCNRHCSGSSGSTHRRCVKLYGSLRARNRSQRSICCCDSR